MSALLLRAATLTLCYVHTNTNCIGRAGMVPTQVFGRGLLLTDNCGEMTETHEDTSCGFWTKGTALCPDIEYKGPPTSKKCTEQCLSGELADCPAGKICPSGDFAFVCSKNDTASCTPEANCQATLCTCYEPVNFTDPGCKIVPQPNMCIEDPVQWTTNDLSPETRAKITTKDCTEGGKAETCVIECGQGYAFQTKQCTCTGLKPGQYQTMCPEMTCEPHECAIQDNFKSAVPVKEDNQHVKYGKGGVNDDGFARYRCSDGAVPHRPGGSAIYIKGGDFYVPCLITGHIDPRGNDVCGWDPDLVRGSSCGAPVPIPLATAQKDPTTGQLPTKIHHLSYAQYKCNEGMTTDGTGFGPATFKLQCRNGFYPGYEGKGCIKVDKGAVGDTWPGEECPWHIFQNRVDLLDLVEVDSKGKEKRTPTVDYKICNKTKRFEGESCVVKCTKGFYQAMPTGSVVEGLAKEDETPVLLICTKGELKGNLPTCRKSDDVMEFDVYGLLRSNPDNPWWNNGGDQSLFYPLGDMSKNQVPIDKDRKLSEDLERVPKDPKTGKSVPSNMNVFDMEGLLVNLYVQVSRFQQDLSNMANLYKHYEDNGRDYPDRNHRVRDASGYYGYLWKAGDYTGSTGNSAQKFPRLPVFRDVVDTVVWYRIKTKNPKVATKYLTFAQFGVYADFQFGGAANEDAPIMFDKSGGAVGAKLQQNAFITMFIPRTKDDEGKDIPVGSRKTAAYCTKKSGKRTTASWLAVCNATRVPQYDREYVPSGDYTSFSLPGRCPAKRFGPFKNNSGRPDIEDCTKDMEGLPAGLCIPEDGNTPATVIDRKQVCTYTIEEVSRVRLDELTGVKGSGVCPGGCRDFKDFQRRCSRQDWWNGIMMQDKKTSIPEDIRRECMEYAVLPFKPEGAKWDPDADCGGETAESRVEWLYDNEPDSFPANSPEVAQARIMFEYPDKFGDNPFLNLYSCRPQDWGKYRPKEYGIPFFMDRCNAAANAKKVKSMRELMERYAYKKIPPLTMIQDCDKFKSCNKVSSGLRRIGLGWCHRSNAGVCSNCYVPDTSQFKYERVGNLPVCRLDLFSSGGYYTKPPYCSSRYGAKYKGVAPKATHCCNYINKCKRTWDFPTTWIDPKTRKRVTPALDSKGWSNCGAGDCGSGVQQKKAECPWQEILGDCRRQLGDPKKAKTGSGYCYADTQNSSNSFLCFEMQECVGRNCPWSRYCNTNMRQSQSQFCISQDWSPWDSECAWGYVKRYQRCSKFPGNFTLEDGEEVQLCNESNRMFNFNPIKVRSKRIVPTQTPDSKRYCGNCPLEQSGCPENGCASANWWSPKGKGDSKCTNLEPFVEMRLFVDLPASSKPKVLDVGFDPVEKVLKDSMAEALGWKPEEVAMVDIYQSKEKIPAAAVAGQLRERRLERSDDSKDGAGHRRLEPVTRWVMDIALWRNKINGKDWISDNENWQEEKVVTTPVVEKYLQEAVPGENCTGTSRSKCLESRMQKGLGKVLSVKLRDGSSLEPSVTVELDRSVGSMKLYCRNTKEAESNEDWSVCYERTAAAQSDLTIAYSAGSAVIALSIFAFGLLICKSREIGCFKGGHDEDEDHVTELASRRDEPLEETIAGTNIKVVQPKKSITTTFSPGHWRIKEKAPRVHDTSFDGARVADLDGSSAGVVNVNTGNTVSGEVDTA